MGRNLELTQNGPTSLIVYDKALILLLVVYPFLLENARMTDAVEGYSLFSVVPFPREIRVLEIVIVVFLSARTLFKPRFVIHCVENGIAVLFLLALMSLAIQGSVVPVMTSLQVVYVYLLFGVPIVLISRVRNVEKMRSVLLRALFLLYLLNLAAGVIQMGWFAYRNDNITGLLRDAHYFSTVVLFGLFYLVARFVLERKTVSGFLLIVASAIAFIGASNQKAYILGPLCLIISLVATRALKPKTLLLGGAIASVFMLIGVEILGSLDETLFDRMEVLKNLHFMDLAPIASYSDLVKIVSGSSMAFFVGVGPGNFADPITFASVAANPDFPVTPLFQEYIGSSDVVQAMVAVGAFTWRTNYATALAVEIGVIAGLLFYGLVWNVLSSLRKRFHQRTEPGSRALIVTLFFSLLYLGANSLISVAYVFEAIAVTWPLFSLIALEMRQGVDKGWRE